jgi:hypothetical protein
MNIRTESQNKALHLLLGKVGIDQDTKADMVFNYTDGRTMHSAEMTCMECDALIRALRKMIPDIMDKKRKRVIANMAEAGFIRNGKPDMFAINEWVLKQGLKKPLNDHSSAELSKLIYASDQVRIHFLNKIRK